MTTVSAGEDVVKARFFDDDDGSDDYAKLVVHRDLLADDEKATRVLDELRDAIAEEVNNE